MKLFLTASGNSMSDVIDPSFGRCSYFLIYETEDDSYEFIENSYQNEQTSVGASVAEYVVDSDIKTVISVNPGPRAFKIFQDAGIEVYHAPEKTKLRDAIISFSKNELILLEAYLPHRAKYVGK
jgi:predicted Fe-Mo cluster-binding NifX family protein